MERPLVTVVVPTYKRNIGYLSRAVKSIQNQTYSNIEIIVIDDSPESYEERVNIKKYMDSIVSERIIYMQNEHNLGGSLARNRGIFAAKGKYISFLDDDDEYLKDKIEKQVRFMSQGGYDLSFSDMTIYDTKGHIVDYREYNDIPSFDNKTLLHYHLMKQMTGTPTFMYVKEKLWEIGGFEDAKMGQEFYLMLKSIEQGLKIGYLPECDVKIYKHEDGAITQGKNKINGEKNLYHFKKRYFPILNIRERMFVRFRHWAVLAVAYKRNCMYLKMIGAAMVSVFCSPVDFVIQVTKFISNVLKRREQ